jgi:hypothetical protein
MQGKKKSTIEDAEFLTMVGLIGLIACWVFFLITNL